MTDDSGHPTHPSRPRPSLWDLPRVLEAQLRSSQLERDIHIPHLGPIEAGHPIQEIVTKLDGPVPVRALSPELVIDNIRLTEGRAEDERTLIFYATPENKLSPGAQVRLAWTRLPPDENVTPATLRAPGDREGDTESNDH